MTEWKETPVTQRQCHERRDSLCTQFENTIDHLQEEQTDLKEWLIRVDGRLGDQVKWLAAVVVELLLAIIGLLATLTGKI